MKFKITVNKHVSAKLQEKMNLKKVIFETLLNLLVEMVSI